MSAQLLLEHGDFKKAKRALFSTSAVLGILVSLDFQSDQIVIFSLKLGVNQTQIVMLAVVGVLYFLYIFSLYSYHQYRLIKLDRAIEIAEETLPKVEHLLRSYVLNNIEFAHDKLISGELERDEILNPKEATSGLLSNQDKDNLVDLIISRRINDKSASVSLLSSIGSQFGSSSSAIIGFEVLVDIFPPFMASFISLSMALNFLTDKDILPIVL